MKMLYELPTGIEVPQSGFSPLELVEVSRSDKLRLLQAGIKSSQEAWPETEHVLARLRHFHPSTAQEFGLKGDAISQAPLRFLCQFSGQHQQDSVRSIDSFIALSYCWHNADWEPADGLGHPEIGWPISSRMVYGLLKQRVSSSEGIWIDRCCINQIDESEKSFAIGSMDLIFKSARKIVVILEDVRIPEQDETLLQDLLSRPNPYNWTPRNESIPALVQVLARILSARWFRRAWCSHELQLGTDFVFLIAAGNVVLEFTMDSLEALCSETSDYVQQHEDAYALLVDTYLSYDFLTRAMDSMSKQQLGKSLMSAFSDIDQLDCSVRTDKVCIAINTANLQLYFTGQDKSSDQCRWLLAMIALSAGDAIALCGIDDLLKLGYDNERSSYSWLNWSNDGGDTMEVSGASTLREPSGIKKVAQDHITLDLLYFSDFDIKGPSDISSCCAEAVLADLSIQMSNKESFFRPFWLRPRSRWIDQRREQLFVMDILACSLDCGLDWMMKQMTFSETLAMKVQRSLESADFDFWPFVSTLFILRGLMQQPDLNNLPDQKKISLLQYFYFVVFYSPLGEADSSPSYFDNKLARAEEGKLIRCGWFDMGTSGKALVALGYGLKGPYKVAIPFALSDTPCFTTRRLWFLQRSDESDRESWVIMEKFRVLTLQPIEEDAREIIRRNDQTIVNHCSKPIEVLDNVQVSI